MPATKEGWLVLLVYISIILALAFTLDPTSSGKEVMFMLVLPFVILTAMLIRIAYKKGEKPKWSWGEPEASQEVVDDSTEENHPTT